MGDKPGCFLFSIQLFLIVIAFLTCTAVFADEINTSSLIYGKTYTSDELAAMERALYAANMTFLDLKFEKSYAKGYECFSLVLDMMNDPLIIAQRMDEYNTRLKESEISHKSPCREMVSLFDWVLTQEQRESLADYSSTIDMGDISEIGSLDTEGLVKYATKILSRDISLPYSDEELLILRDRLPYQMAWHDVFGSPLNEEEKAKVESMMKDTPEDFLYNVASKFNQQQILESLMPFSIFYSMGVPALKTESFPKTEPFIVSTEYGRIALGTIGDNYYSGDFTFLIDPGGNDHYVNCRIGAAFGYPTSDLGVGRLGFFADLGGNDVYDCAETNITLGSGVLGVGVFYDLGSGNDKYYAGSLTLGASVGGIGVFYDDGGSDIYDSKVYTQGAAGFGIGLMVDDSVNAPPVIPTDVETPDPIEIAGFDNDSYRAWTNAQAFARTRGIAICSNKRGNEVYHSGGVYLHAPLFQDRYQGFSQGFAIGERGIDYAGGIALIIDHAGNDRYLGDIYNQGVGYWYSAGLLYDEAGNDVYEMTQYGQGSGIHLAIGGLVDCSGSDTYVMHSGLGQGGSHDFAASILHDRGGDDRYLGNTSCNGCGLTNSVGIHLDRSGNDLYAGRRDGGVNTGRPARGFASIGILADLAGTDEYLGIMKDNALWRHTDIGVGWDIAPPPQPEAQQFTSGPNVVSGVAQIPEVCSFKGEISQVVFDELWEISVRWEVGDNRYIVPAARKRIIEFGESALPFISEAMNTSASGLEIRAYVEIFNGLFADGFKQGVLNVIRENASSSEEVRYKTALTLIGELKLTDLEDIVIGFLDSKDPAMVRRAIGVLQLIGSHAADETLIGYLTTARDDEKLLRAAVTVLMSLDVDCYADIRPLFDSDLMSIRTTIVELLVSHWATYGESVRDDIINGNDLSIRSKRTLLDAIVKLNLPAPPVDPEAEIAPVDLSIYYPDSALVETVTALLSNDDWGVRADAVRVIRHWQVLPDIDKFLIKPAVAKLYEILGSESDPYVLFVSETKK